MSDKRFHYRPFSRAIYDSLTGYLYVNLDDIANLLNELNKSEQVMKKYGIDSVEKLDQVLFNQKVW